MGEDRIIPKPSDVLTQGRVIPKPSDVLKKKVQTEPSIPLSSTSVSAGSTSELGGTTSDATEVPKPPTTLSLDELALKTIDFSNVEVPLQQLGNTPKIKVPSLQDSKDREAKRLNLESLLRKGAAKEPSILGLPDEKIYGKYLNDTQDEDLAKSMVKSFNSIKKEHDILKSDSQEPLDVMISPINQGILQNISKANVQMNKEGLILQGKSEEEADVQSKILFPENEVQKSTNSGLNIDKVKRDYLTYLYNNDIESFNDINKSVKAGGFNDKKSMKLMQDALVHQKNIVDLKINRVLSDGVENLTEEQINQVEQLESQRGKLSERFKGVLLDYPEVLKKEVENRLVQKEVDESYKEAKAKALDFGFKGEAARAEVLYRQVVAPVGAQAVKLVGDLSQFALHQIANFTPDEKVEGIANIVADWANGYFDTEKSGSIFKKPTELKGALFEDKTLMSEGGFKPEKLVPKVSETLFQMYALLGGGSAAGGVLEAAGIGTGTAQKIGLITSSFGLTQNDYYQEAKEAGLSNNQANNFGNAAALLTSTLELVNPQGYVFGKESKKGFTKSVVDAIKDGVDMKTAIKQNSKFIAKELAGENIQEISQELGDLSVKYLFNKKNEDDKFDIEVTQNQIKELVILTSIVSGLGSAHGVKGRNQLETESLWAATQDIEKFNQFMQSPELKEQFSEEEILGTIKKVGEYKKIVDGLPETLDEQSKIEAAKLVYAKTKLKEQQKEVYVDDVVAKRSGDKIQTQIDEINGQIEIIFDEQTKTDVDTPVDSFKFNEDTGKVEYKINDKFFSEQEIINNLGDEDFIKSVKEGVVDLTINNPSENVSKALEGSGLLTKPQLDEVKPVEDVKEKPVDKEEVKLETKPKTDETKTTDETITKQGEEEVSNGNDKQIVGEEKKPKKIKQTGRIPLDKRNVANKDMLNALSIESGDLTTKVMQWFVSGRGKLSSKAVSTLLGSQSEVASRASMIRSEANGGKSIDAITHDIWESLDGAANDIDSRDIRAIVEDVVKDNNTRSQIAKALNKIHGQEIIEVDGVKRDSSGEELFETPNGLMTQSEIDDYVAYKEMAAEKDNADEIAAYYENLTDEDIDIADEAFIEAKIDEIDAEYKIQEKTTAPSKTQEKFKSVADNIRKLKTKEAPKLLDKDGNEIIITKQGLDWNDLVEKVAIAVEKTGDVAAAISDYLSDKEWFNSLSDENKVTVENQIKESIVEAEPKKESKTATAQSGFQKRTLQQAEETPAKEQIKNIVESNKVFYDVMNIKETVDLAKKRIEKDGGVNASFDRLVTTTPTASELAVLQVERQIALDFYGAELDAAIKEGRKNDADKSYKRANMLQEAISKDATRAGQASAMLAAWKALRPDGTVEFLNRKINEYNEGVKSEKKNGQKETVGEKIDNFQSFVESLTEEQIDEILTSELGKSVVDKIISKNAPKFRNNLNDRVKKRKEKVDSVINRLNSLKIGGDKLYALPAGINLAPVIWNGSIEIIKKSIQAGETMATAIDKAIVYIKENIGDNDSFDEKIYKKQFEEEKKSLDTNTDLGSEIDDILKQEGIKIKDVISKHYKERDVLGRGLAEKLIEDAGLSKEDAEVVSKMIQNEFAKKVREAAEKELSKTIGTTKLPVDKKVKKMADELINKINLGALDSDFYNSLFADKFGLAAQLTPEQAAELKRLATIAQEQEPGSLLERMAVKDMMVYMNNLYPKGGERVNTFLSLYYASMLSGMTTTALNLISAGSNIILKPVRDTVNLTKWVNAVRKGIEGGSIKDFLAYSPFNDIFYMPIAITQAASVGSKEFAEVWKNGDIDSKFIEQISSKKFSKINPLERARYGKHAFKPVNVKIGSEKYSLNPFNYYKYVGRALAAQDKIMFRTSYELEMVSIIRDKYLEKGLRGTELRKAVISEFTNNHIDMDVVNTKLDKEVAKYEDTTGKKITKAQRAIRLREILENDIPVETRETAENIGRSNIFTDRRGGMIAETAAAIGKLTNKSQALALTLKPWVPFTTIVGNVSEYMMDTVPIYGQMRANGLGISNLIKLGAKDFNTSQMGVPGTKEYSEQMGRAWLGTVAATIAGMMLIGTDDEDEIYITGGYAPDKFKRGRENVTPKYTLVVKGVEIPYLNIPGLAIPLALIGNYNDRINYGDKDEDLSDRLAASSLSSVVTFTDMSFVKGIQDLIEMVSDISSGEVNKTERTGQELYKKYFLTATKPLPQNFNLVDQIEKLFDPTSYSQREIKDITAYGFGVQRWVNKPSTDIFGETVKTYPGETLLPYTHWMGLKGDDARWRFLSRYNAIPSSIQGSQEIYFIDKDYEVERRKPETEELRAYTILAGSKFSEMLIDYMGESGISERESEEVIQGGKKITGVQKDIQTLWSNAKLEARDELFDN